MYANLPVPMDGTETTRPDYVYNSVQYSHFYLLIILQILVSNIVLQIWIISLTILPENVSLIVALDYLLKFNQEHVWKLALKIS